MDGLTMKLIDLLRMGADKRAMGPMQYDISSGHARPINKARQLLGVPNPDHVAPRRDQKIADALREAGV